MAHFAELNENNTVVRVIVVSNNDCIGQDGQESEEVGVLFCQKLLGGRWVQTSYNSTFRKLFAGEGYLYDEENDVFIRPQPYASWVLDENHDWQPPVPMPVGLLDYEKAVWNENLLAWEVK